LGAKELADAEQVVAQCIGFACGDGELFAEEASGSQRHEAQYQRPSSFGIQRDLADAMAKEVAERDLVATFFERSDSEFAFRFERAPGTDGDGERIQPLADEVRQPHLLAAPVDCGEHRQAFSRGRLHPGEGVETAPAPFVHACGRVEEGFAWECGW
jgi:hypothetical protein